MRERGRVRERGAAPRANLGLPSRSSPSPEVRQIRGGHSADSEVWTEVRRRRWKELREVDREQDRPGQ
ncbi:hypothetical protein A2U01_0067555, partial [Trifolium medium]|nr:hypothetical protein [Trifolium medium]